jgi:hypothetical protein
VVGSIFAVFLGRKESLLWALLTSDIAMCIYALMTQLTFFHRITFFEIGIIINYYALPLAFAVGGALVIHMATDRKKQNDIEQS